MKHKYFVLQRDFFYGFRIFHVAQAVDFPLGKGMGTGMGSLCCSITTGATRRSIIDGFAFL